MLHLQLTDIFKISFKFILREIKVEISLNVYVGIVFKTN